MWLSLMLCTIKSLVTILTGPESKLKPEKGLVMIISVVYPLNI